ncbi:ATP:ADP antiporter, AAA family [Nematocida homosporus]|uniref:ATP:ADP antiporter, AAA family n=1 Tax=Nematocida homosporus TaxID=1912981 RepID=UPI002220FE26|nr:ATP:ADP antiporter, AAA family [Nematocida homosporus]KAI5186021.1 ATP:ADP antiporter, AAA family [Nematocida homosporus]
MSQNIAETNTKQRPLPTEDVHEKKAEDECYYLFRVLPVEYPKFFSLAFLGLSISFIYSTLRDGKDTLVMSRMLPTSISFLKSTMVLISTMAFGIFFQMLMSKGVKMRTIMIGAHVVFASYFLVYALVIFPFREQIEPYKYAVMDMFADGKMKVNGLEFLNGFLCIFNCWTGSLFYVAAEMWGSVVLSLLFFGCVNELCLLRQALRFYPLFLIAANLALVGSGLIGVVVSSLATSDQFIETFYKYFLLGIAGLSVVNIFVYKYLMDRVVPYPLYIVDGPPAPKKSKTKVGLMAGIKMAFSNRIILCMSISVLAYGVVTNLTESAINSSTVQAADARGSSAASIGQAAANAVSEAHKTKAAKVMYTKAIQQINIGTVTILFLISPLKNLIQTRGWLSLGLLSPIFSLIGSTILFMVMWLNVQTDSKSTGFLATLARSLGQKLTPDTQKRLNLEVNIGVIVVSAIKILKYAAFDICKEAIGVKIPKEHRSRLKGVYDGVFGKLGKSTSAAVQIILLGIINTNDIRQAVLIIGSASILITILWLYATVYLSKQYTQAVKDGRDLPVAPTEDATTTNQAAAQP